MFEFTFTQTINLDKKYQFLCPQNINNTKIENKRKKMIEKKKVTFHKSFIVHLHNKRFMRGENIS